MKCPHCDTTNPIDLPYNRSLEGGRAYARQCRSCGHVMQIRARDEGDPPAVPAGLSAAQVARLRFVRWRLAPEAEAQTHLADQSPYTAA